MNPSEIPRNGPLFLQILVLVASGSMAAQEPETGLIRGPYLQQLAPDAVEIVWSTRGVEGDAILHLAHDGGAVVAHPRDELSCLPPTDDARCHRVRVDGLQASKHYTYELYHGEELLAASDEFRFRTPPPRGGGQVRFVAFGDSGAEGGAQDAVTAIVERLEPDAILHTGDLDYREAADLSIFGPYRDLLPHACLFPVRGNHDLLIPYEDLFFPPGVPEPEGDEKRRTYYSFDWGAAHIVAFDTTLGFEPDGASGEQIDWLCRDLERARTREDALPWLIVITHEPLFTIGLHANSPEPIAARHTLAPILDAYDVDLVLSGDDHNYQASHPLRMSERWTCADAAPLSCLEDDDRKDCYEVTSEEEPHYVYPDGTVYVVTGGGGQRLYSIDDENDDRAFSRIFERAWHVVQLDVSSAALQLEAVGFARGGVATLDRFSITKLRLLRGDVEPDGVINLTDAVAILQHLFRGRDLACAEAGDVDGDMALNLTDAVYTLQHLFRGGAAPSAPYPDCGPVASPALLPCDEPSC